MINKKIKIDDILVSEFMIYNPIFTTPEAKISNTELLMLRKKIGGLPVVKDEVSKELIGIITQRDIRLARFAMDLETTKTRVRDLMTENPIFVKESDNLKRVMKLMFENDIERLPVVDTRNQLIGIVSQTDVLKVLYKILV
ncbi:MAG: CBS domain-containing protein [Promethearchaeota archaeon]